MNPRNLELGQYVTAKRSCSIVWDNEEKVLSYEDKPVAGKVIGISKRALGKYIRGTRWPGWSGEDYDPPQFKATKYVWLYVVCADFGALQYNVAPEDIDA
jgi:hypothetical protein